jgi:hypothetical protein
MGKGTKAKCLLLISQVSAELGRLIEAHKQNESGEAQVFSVSPELRDKTIDAIKYLRDYLRGVITSSEAFFIAYGSIEDFSKACTISAGDIESGVRFGSRRKINEKYEPIRVDPNPYLGSEFHDKVKELLSNIEAVFGNEYIILENEHLSRGK